jgi:hypothetical protein
MGGIIVMSMSARPVTPMCEPDFAALLPHAQATLSADSDGIQQIAAYLGSSGSYAAARNLYKEVLDARIRVLGQEHPDTHKATGAQITAARWAFSVGLSIT